MPVQFIDRFKVTPEDWEAAREYAVKEAKRLGLVCDKQIGVITVYSSDEFWLLDADGVPSLSAGPNPDMVTLAFNLGDEWRPEPYLRKIEFDVGSGEHSELSGWDPSTNWQPSETSGDPPETLEELIERGGNKPHLLARAKEFSEFYELYAGIYGRLFPQVEHEDVHTDTSGFYEEAKEKKASRSHITKEIWRTDLLTALQGLRFPHMEIEGEGTKCRVIWEPEGHTSYMIWFSLDQGEDPKVCAYCDPTQSGSTQGRFSTRLIKNENALAKLPYTIEQWVIQDLGMKDRRGPEYKNWRNNMRELLRHRVPRELEEVWASLRRQIVGTPHEDVHTDTGFYEESLTARESDFRLLKDREEIERLHPGDQLYLVINPGKENEEFFSAKVVNVLAGEGMVKIYVDEPDIGWKEEERTRVYSANTYLYLEDLPTEHEDVHTDTGYFESVGEEQERYYGIATGDGNSGISHMRPEYIVLTNDPWELATLAAHAQFKDDPGVQEWVGKNMEIDGDANYGITVVFQDSIEAQEAREEEFERRKAAAEEAGEDYDPEDDYDDYGNDFAWFMIDIFPMDQSEVDRLNCDVYDSHDHPDFLAPLFPPPEHEDVHTDTGFYESVFLSHLPEQFRLKG